MPGELGHAAVGDAFNPTLTDGVGDGVAVNGGGRCLEVAVVAVEELMPEAFTGLQGTQASDMFAQLVQDELAVRM